MTSHSSRRMAEYVFGAFEDVHERSDFSKRLRLVYA
jgi:hypothetical protein